MPRPLLFALLLAACTGTAKDAATDSAKPDSSEPVDDTGGDDTGAPADDSAEEVPFDPANFANFVGDQVNFFQLTPEGATCTLRFTLSGTVVVQSDCPGCEFTVNLTITFDAANSTVVPETCGFAASGGSGMFAYHPNFDGLGPSFVFPGETPFFYTSAQLSGSHIRFGYGYPSLPASAFSMSPLQLTPAGLNTTLDELQVGELLPN